MASKIYKSVDNPQMGFAIKESSYQKGEFEIWIDYYEGGQCYDNDWRYEEETFISEEEAMTYITENYGKVVELSTEIYMNNQGKNPTTGVKEYYSVEELREMALKYPNDQELGGIFRNEVMG